MILYALTFLASALIGVLFYRINFSELMQKLISSYKNSGVLLAQSSNDASDQSDLLLREVKSQFMMLSMLVLRFLFLLSPGFLLVGCMYLFDLPVEQLFGFLHLLISTVAFLFVYLIKTYAGRPAQ